MPSNLDAYKEDLEKLCNLGSLMLADLSFQNENIENLNEKQKQVYEKTKGAFDKHYQDWYSESISVVRQLIPDRLEEFNQLYKGDGKRKNIDLTTFTIQDWLRGMRSQFDTFRGGKGFDDVAVVGTRFSTQLSILKSVRRRFDSKLFEIKQLVQADLFDSEIDAGKQLLKNGYFRAAGVIAGVVLEAHLQQVCVNHRLSTRKKSPGISDYNELLKANSVIDVPTWRFVQRLGDIRNICGHKKEREPEKVEVQELLDGVEKITKTVY